MKKALPLSLLQTALLPGTETAWQSDYWSFGHVCDGLGYVLHGEQPQTLSQDQFILIPAHAAVGLRASQLSPLTLCHFELCPEDLPGLFSVLEERTLAQAAHDRRVPVRVLAVESPLSRQFASLCEMREREPALILRSEMLRLSAHALREAVCVPPPAVVSSTEERFRKLMASSPAAELMSQPARELARGCVCSERHFRRLFKEEIGLPLRAWQIQGRIRKAARLLRETDAKVVDVALECGFQHLGQFNATFKRLLGKTPTLWRRSGPLRRPARCYARGA